MPADAVPGPTDPKRWRFSSTRALVGASRNLVWTHPRRSAAAEEAGGRTSGTPFRVAPAPTSARYMSLAAGCQIHAALVSPPRTSATITAHCGDPETKLAVPSRGSTSQICSLRSACASPEPPENSSSPTKTASGISSPNRVFNWRSASSSATVTSSPGDLNRTSVSRRASKRGSMASAETSWSMSPTLSIRSSLVADTVATMVNDDFSNVRPDRSSAGCDPQRADHRSGVAMKPWSSARITGRPCVLAHPHPTLRTDTPTAARSAPLGPGEPRGGRSAGRRTSRRRG